MDMDYNEWRDEIVLILRDIDRVDAEEAEAIVERYGWMYGEGWGVDEAAEGMILRESL